MKLDKYKKIIKDTSPETKENINFSMDVLERIHELLDKKFQGKQKLLADKLSKTEPEVSKWFNGVQNFTLKTIFKLEWAFGEKIIAVTNESNCSTFIQVKNHFSEGYANFVVDLDGGLLEAFQNIKKPNIDLPNYKSALPA